MKNTSAQIVQIGDIKRRKVPKISRIGKTSCSIITKYQNVFGENELIKLKEREDWMSSLIFLMGKENELGLEFSKLPDSFMEVAMYIANFLYDVTFDLPKGTRIKDLPLEKLNLEGKIQKFILEELNLPFNNELSHKKLIKYINEWIDEIGEDSDFPFFLIQHIDIVIHGVWIVLNKNLMFIDVYNNR